MILGYGAKNCWCFKDWMEIDMTLDGNVPKDVSLNLPAATAMCFRGANASGKTNGLKVLSFIIYFATDSFLSKPDDEIPYDAHFYSSEPSEFYIVTRSDEAVYTYEFTVSSKTVLEEKISRKYNTPGSRETLVFHRTGNAIDINSLYSGHSDMPLRSNASIISILHQYGIEEVNDIYETMQNVIMNVTYLGMDDRIMKNYEEVAKMLSSDPARLEYVTSMLRKFDTGIDSVDIKTRKDEQGKPRYYPVFYHKRETGASSPMLFQYESSGTQKLFCQLLFYSMVLETGGMMILDEMDNNLHPDILPYLIDMFIIDANNEKHAQLIFTTQNDAVMDIMGRYRTCIFEKKDGESICYRVDEVGLKNLRNDRPISVPYKKKLLGGVPVIGKER